MSGENVFDPTYGNDPSLPPLPRLPNIEFDYLYPGEPYDDSPVPFDDDGDISGVFEDHELSPSEAFAGQGFLQDELGNAYKIDDSGNLTFKDSSGTDFTYNEEKGGFTDKDGNFAGGNNSNSLLDYVKKYGKAALDLLKDKNGKYSPAKLLSLGIGAYGLLKKDEQGGYSRPVPKLDMVREQVQYNDPNRRPGEGGRQYFTDPRFVAQGNAEALAAAKAASAEQAAGIQAAYKARPAEAPNPYAGKMNLAFSRPAEQAPVSNQPTGLPQIPEPFQLNAQGGIGMAQGGIADAGRYLQGKTDGMADEIPSSIDGEQPAALSHGEFVIPADVVSHLGNGNSDAGAQKLYEMMSRIRQARTGTKEQGKEINADEFTMGGLANAYASGGQVQRFSLGGPTTPAPAQTAAGIPQDVSRTSTLSPYVGEYVTDALARGSALANAPYEAYQGPLTAGASDLQNQAFAGASDIAGAGFTPTQFSGGLFDTQAAQSYMNPYIQSALDPQLRELQRQSDIQRTQDAGRLTRAGAFGGGRQAIMESEGRRNLLDKQQDVLGQGYATAYDKAMAQFNADQNRSMDAQKATEASRQYGAGFGLKSVDQLANLGAVERGITSEGLAADKAQFEEQRDFAYGMPKYQLSLLSGLPIAANTTSVDQDAMGKLDTAISGSLSRFKTIEKMLKELGVKPG